MGIVQLSIPGDTSPEVAFAIAKDATLDPQSRHVGPKDCGENGKFQRGSAFCRDVTSKKQPNESGRERETKKELVGEIPEKAGGGTRE